MALGRINTSCVYLDMELDLEPFWVVDPDGTQHWYSDAFHQDHHRVDGPAFIGVNGHQEWWVKGRRHCLSGPAVIFADGTEEWYVDGLAHRVDGAAYMGADGNRVWYVNGIIHRIDGPAIVYLSNEYEWYINGELVSTEVEAWMEARNISWPWDESTQVEFTLTWT